MISGCSKTSEPSNELTGSVSPFVMDETVRNQLSAVMGQWVQSDEPLALFEDQDGKLVEVGTLAAHQKVSLDSVESVENAYLPLRNSAFYLDGTQVQKADFNKRYNNHLIPFNESVKTVDHHSLLDKDGNIVVTLYQSGTYPIYVKDEDRLGVLFQEKLVYLNNDEIETTFENENTNQLSAESIPVLMYHFFYDESVGQKRKDGNYVEANELREQLAALKEGEWVSLTMQELELVLKKKALAPLNSFVMTIDDGDPSVYEIAYPIIKESGYNAVLFLITGWLDEQLPFSFIEMREDGLELQSHSFLMHQGGCKGLGHGGRLLCVDQEEGIKDTIQSMDYVDGGFVYCYPFGDVNDHAIEILKESGIRLAFTTEYGKVQAGMDLYRLPRIRVTGGAGLERFMRGLN